MFKCRGSQAASWSGQIFLETIPEKMHSNERKRVDGERGRTRTCDPCLKRALLYQLSYAPTII